jgi:hypothetical protein
MAEMMNVLIPDAISQIAEKAGENMDICEPKVPLYRTDGNISIVSPAFVSIEDVFNKLYMQWREQTKFDSFIGNSTDTYYEKIIQLGDSVVPLIIDKLRKENAHLFIALSRITGENPVKKENMGKVKKMAEDWIQWWDERKNDMG